MKNPSPPNFFVVQLHHNLCFQFLQFVIHHIISRTLPAGAGAKKQKYGGDLPGCADSFQTIYNGHSASVYTPLQIRRLYT